MSRNVLFVDDEPHVINALKRALHKEPYEILTANSAREALDILAHTSVDLVVSDEMMPGMSGSDFLSIVCRNYPDTIRIVLTGHATLDATIRAINEGRIYRFFTKPWNDVDLAVTIREALHLKDLIEENKKLLKKVRRQKAVIRDLEKQYPGITDVKRDSGGTILLDDFSE